VVDVAFFREALTADNVVVDIGRAHDALKATLAPLNYRNLDDIPEFKDQQTTTEFLSRNVFDAMADAARSARWGRRRGDRTHPRDLGMSRMSRAPGSRVGREMRIIFAAPGDLAARTGGYGMIAP